MAKVVDISGSTYGSLLVLNFSHIERNRAVFLCRCSCGKEVLRRGNSLKTGNTKTCGDSVHYIANNSPTYSHGKTMSAVWRAWIRIKNRCNNPKNPSFPFYGGRGVSLADEFLDFHVFYEHIGDPPDDTGWSVDRIDNNVGYVRGNLRWATPEQQSRNHGKRYDNTTGWTGLHLAEKKGMFRYVAVWKDPATYVQNSKAFSLNKYGLLPSMYFANCTRRNEIWFMNMQGAGYGKSHGELRRNICESI